MGKKVKLEATIPQLEAIIYLADTLSAMVGGCDPESSFDDDVTKAVRLVDRVLNNAGYKRHFN